jgi:flagellin
MATINTNVGAQVALQSLNKTNASLEVTQNRISTGLKVSSAKDNGAVFAVASGLRAESGALDAVKSSLGRGQAILDVGLAAAENVLASLEELKALSVNIAGSTGAANTAYQADFTAIKANIDKAIANATFDGVAILSSAATTVISDTTATGRLTIGAGALTVTLTSTSTIGAVTTAINTFGASVARIGTQHAALTRQLTFIGKLQDATDAGIGNLVDADLAKESARFTALQTKQQLGAQALSIANQAPNILLSLFR